MNIFQHPGKKMEDRLDRREFRRVSIEFETDITAKDIKGKTFHDRAVLKNVSGSGASFLTQLTESYYGGQFLEMVIYFPGTKDVKACMKADAIVIRTGAADGSRPDGERLQKSIALVFDSQLHFERLDREDNKTE